MGSSEAVPLGWGLACRAEEAMCEDGDDEKSKTGENGGQEAGQEVSAQGRPEDGRPGLGGSREAGREAGGQGGRGRAL